MTKENLLKELEKARKAKDTVYEKSLLASAMTSWDEDLSIKSDKSKKS